MGCTHGHVGSVEYNAAGIYQAMEFTIPPKKVECSSDNFCQGGQESQKEIYKKYTKTSGEQDPLTTVRGLTTPKREGV